MGRLDHCDVSYAWFLMVATSKALEPDRAGFLCVVVCLGDEMVFASARLRCQFCVNLIL